MFYHVAAHGLPEEKAQIYSMAQQFASEKLLPFASEWDKKEIFPGAYWAINSALVQFPRLCADLVAFSVIVTQWRP